MADLVLPLKREYFEEIKAGLKPEEFRLCTPYWAKRLEGRSYDRVILTLGYPAKDDSERRLARPWRGFVKRQITHPHFGAELVDVYAIDVREVVMAKDTDSSEPDLNAIADQKYKFTYGDLKKQAQSEAVDAWMNGLYSLRDNPFIEGSWSHQWWHDAFAECEAGR